MTEEFDSWLAKYMGTEKNQVSTLIQDKMAIEFLISWSIFESDCFKGYCKISDLKQYSENIHPKNLQKLNILQSHVRYFHERYQDKSNLKKLIHKQNIDFFTEILKKKVSHLSKIDEMFLLLVVVYRYRNNIFHGNKGIESWLKYRDQIRMCCQIMQALIEISETAHNKSKHADAA